MIKKIKELTCKALVLSMLASTVLPGFSGSAYGAYGEKAAADSEKTEYVLSEIDSLLKRRYNLVAHGAMIRIFSFTDSGSP